MTYTHLFHGDHRHGEDPLVLLAHLESALPNLPHLSETEKCYRFYLNCKLDSDAEYWYEELESNSPMALTSWSTFVKHFRVKWL
jgi:hypothetical protein